MQKLLLPFATLLAFLLVPASALATDTYKCTAEDGSISYWDKKPTSGCASVELVKIHVGRGTAGEAEDGTALSEQDKKVAKEREKQMKEREEQAKQVCDQKSQNLSVLKNKSRVRIKDADGNERIMTPEEHQSKIEEIDQYLKDYCS